VDYYYYLTWWNLIFELPLLGSFLLMLLLAIGTLGEGGHSDIGHGADIGHHVELGHDLGHSTGHSIDHDPGHGVAHPGEPAGPGSAHTTVHPDSVADAHEGASTLMKALMFLGLGRVPITIVLVCFSAIWGVTGFASNLLLNKALPIPMLFVWVSIVLAFLAALLLTRYITIGVARFMPSLETYGVTRSQLTGREGIARYDINDAFGEAQVRDSYGNLQIVNCRTAPGREKIPAGTKIYLLEFRENDGYYIAVSEEQFEEELRPARP
jgi:hypothetical protein